MTDKQLSWVFFGFALLISSFFLSVLVQTNSKLVQMQQIIDIQQKHIEKLDDEHHVIQEQMLKMAHTDDVLAHDIDVTQELQRKQAQVVVDLRKGHKK